MTLRGDDTYDLTVEPNGLLSENMLVYGSLHIVTQEGMEWTIDVELQATSTSEEWWMIWNEPAKVIGLMLVLLSLSTLQVPSTRVQPSQRMTGSWAQPKIKQRP